MPGKLLTYFTERAERCRLRGDSAETACAEAAAASITGQIIKYRQ